MRSAFVQSELAANDVGSADIEGPSWPPLGPSPPISTSCTHWCSVRWRPASSLPIRVGGDAVPQEPAAELHRQPAEHEARDKTHGIASAYQDRQSDDADDSPRKPAGRARCAVNERPAHGNIADEATDHSRDQVGQSLDSQFVVKVTLDAGGAMLVELSRMVSTAITATAAMEPAIAANSVQSTAKKLPVSTGTAGWPPDTALNNYQDLYRCMPRPHGV
jgi:hypothetical protein